jgi:hypothetical protein
VSEKLPSTRKKKRWPTKGQEITKDKKLLIRTKSKMTRNKSLNKQEKTIKRE